MGTTLTGTTPANTYDSLIKVTDNGPLSGTAKYLSDGLGNDSVLALSTSRVGIGTASPSTPLEVQGSLGIRVDEAGTASNVLTLRSDFAGAGPAVNVTTSSPLLLMTANTERMRITSAGNVGIGTSNPSTKLHILNGETIVGSSTDGVKISYSAGNSSGIIDTAFSDNNLEFRTNGTTKMWIANGGNVGIGTASPSNTLSVAKSSSSGSGSSFPRLSVANTLATQGDGSSTFNFSDINVSAGDGAVNMFLATTYAAGTWAPSGQINVSTNHPLIVKTNNTEVARFLAGGGLTFNGDTAAANALDDYEEGTWTMGISFGNASVGVTYVVNTGTYTKIGRQVTVNGYLILSNKGSSTGTARITGLPFTVASGDSNYAGVTFAELAFITRTGDISGYGVVGSTNIFLLETSTLGVISALTDGNFANNSTIMVSFTYFV